MHISVYTDHPQVLKSSTMRYITWGPEDGWCRPKHVVIYLRIACKVIVVFDGYFHKIYWISTAVWIISNTCLTNYVNLVRTKRNVWSKITFTLKEKCPLKNKPEFYKRLCSYRAVNTLRLQPVNAMYRNNRYFVKIPRDINIFCRKSRNFE